MWVIRFAILILLFGAVLSYRSFWPSVAATYTGQTIYALYGDVTVSGNCNLYVSADYGLSYTQIGLPTEVYSSQNNFGVSTNRNSGQYVAIGTSTSLHLSSDYGATWTTTFTSSRSIMSSTMSGNGQYMKATCYDCATVYSSSDYGATWTSYNYGHSNGGNGISLSDSGEYGVLCYYFGIMTTADYGTLWEDGSGYDLSLIHI